MEDIINVSSTTSWKDFEVEVSDKMKILRKDLKLGYKLSTDTQKQRPLILEGQVKWLELII